MKDFSNQDAKAWVLTSLELIDVLAFLFMFTFASYNAYQFLIVQGRWNNFYMLSFYVLTLTITVCRIYHCVENFLFYDYKEEKYEHTWNYFTSTAISAKTILGALQVGSMVELGINVKLSA